jgi:hypothetical protein
MIYKLYINTHNPYLYTYTAGAAKPSPQIGQALGGAGINMMGFCKDFNAKTGQYSPEIPLRCELKVLEDSVRIRAAAVVCVYVCVHRCIYICTYYMPMNMHVFV